jgi:NADH-quinone oxidoreductase subunit L
VSLETYGWLVLAFPLGGAVLIALTSKLELGRLHGVIGTLAIALSFVAAIGAFSELRSLGEEERQVVAVGWDYAVTSGVDGAQVSILLDPLSVLMMLVVSGVSMLIHLWSVAYMAGDHGYARFFAYLNFFVFSMLLLVEAANFFMLIIGWAFVGAASYFLISFWYRRTTATAAGIKAFVINVVGDVGLVLGTYFIFKGTGTLDFLKTFEAMPDAFGRNDGDLVAGCILLLVGAFAKSAQVPLHTWLPDAMEGPTPVSALIHAATMVTAGVYLIARMHPLFEQAPIAADVGAIIGCLTLLIAASIGLVVTDLKRVIAYSTMSQIGYMVMAVSSAAYAAGMFHLMTHAFFKALLFMAAGSVIAAMAGIQDLDRMGGFRRAMPFTFGCMMVGGLALSGVPPFSGFFSKDEILALLFAREDWHIVLGVLGYIGSLLTAIYTFRMIFRAFFGDPSPEAVELEHGHLFHAEHPTNPMTGEIEDTDVGFPGPEHHIAEREFSMKLAMGALAVLALIGGIPQIPSVTDELHTFLEPTFHDSSLYEELDPSGTLTWIGLAAGTVIALTGIFIAYTLWVRQPERPRALMGRLAPVHRFFVNKWYFDEAIDVVFVRPAAWTGRFARTTFERLVVDGALVGGATGTVRLASAAVRRVQTGYLRYYAALLLMGITSLGAYFLIAA